MRMHKSESATRGTAFDTMRTSLLPLLVLALLSGATLAADAAM